MKFSSLQGRNNFSLNWLQTSGSLIGLRCKQGFLSARIFPGHWFWCYLL
jgi:hypothetical protein